MEQYQSNSQYPMQVIPQTSTLSIISLILGIASFVLIPVLGGIAAIVTGNIAKSEINKSQGFLTGSGMATAGLVLGWINVVLVVVPVCLIIVLALLGPAIGTVFSNVVKGV